MEYLTIILNINYTSNFKKKKKKTNHSMKLLYHIIEFINFFKNHNNEINKSYQ